MLRGHGPQLPRQPGPADGVDLVGVDLGRQAAAPPRLQDRPGLLRRKHPGLAEHVAELRQSLRRRRGDHLLAQQPDIGRPVRLVVLRQGVGPQEGGDQIHRMALVQGPDGPQLLKLRVQVQAVSALGLAGGGAEGEHLVQGQPGLVLQRPLSGGPGGPDGGQNAAPLGQDVQVGHPPQLHGQLVLPPAPEDQVGVGVHQTRRDQTALRVQLLRPGGALRRPRAHGGNHAVLNAHPGVSEEPHVPLVRAPAGGPARRGGQKADIFDE